MVRPPKGPNKGDIFECRVARVLHHEGAFVRRKVDLQLYFGEPFTVTDVDVLATTFSSALSRQVTVGECKTTEARSAPNVADRLLWGAGVRRLVPGADRHLLATTKRASDRVRRLATRLGAEVIDERDLVRRERLLGLSPSDLSGPHDPSLIAAETAVFEVSRRDDELKRVWGFVRSDFWFSDEVYGLKRALGALRLLGRRWHPDLPTDEAACLRWLAQEAMAAAVVSVIQLAGDCYRQPAEVFERQLNERLAEGVASYAVMQEISKELDRYVLAVLRESGVDPAGRLDRLGALDPKPPAYAEPLAEVLERLAGAPHATAQLARLLDERIAIQRGSPVPAGAPVIPEAQRAGSLLQTIATFLRGQIRVPDELLAPLLNGAASINGTVTAHRGADNADVEVKTSRGSNAAGKDSTPSATDQPEPAQRLEPPVPAAHPDRAPLQQPADGDTGHVVENVANPLFDRSATEESDR